MENPIGPLITQLGMGLSFVSQHLKVTQKNERNSYVNIIHNINFFKNEHFKKQRKC